MAINQCKSQGLGLFSPYKPWHATKLIENGLEMSTCVNCEIAKIFFLFLQAESFLFTALMYDNEFRELFAHSRPGNPIPVDPRAHGAAVNQHGEDGTCNLFTFYSTGHVSLNDMKCWNMGDGFGGAMFLACRNQCDLKGM